MSSAALEEAGMNLGIAVGLGMATGAAALPVAVGGFWMSTASSAVFTTALAPGGGTEGAVALAEALRTNAALQTLGLRYNSIGAEGAVAAPGPTELRRREAGGGTRVAPGRVPSG